MRVVVAWLLAGLTGSASADPPPSGVYRLERGAPSPRSQHDPKTGKRLRRIPDCKLTDGNPIPQSLVIEYASASPIIVVNREDWAPDGFTTAPGGKPISNPSRVARKPNPPPDTIVTVQFRATGADTSTAVMSVVEHGEGTIRCVVAYEYVGSYEPF